MMQSVQTAPTPNKRLRNFWDKKTVNDNRVRFRVLHGGRDSTKSWDAATRATYYAYKGNLRFLCTRMFQNRIEDSVYTTIKNQIHRFGYSPYFDIQSNKIISHTGSEFLFYGLSRNYREIKSLEGIDILWIEEAQSLTEDMWEILEPTIRKEGSEIWVVFNPYLVTDFAWRRFVENPPENAIVRQINYDENPYLSETSKETIERIKNEDYEAYEHIYLGIPKQDDDSVIIKRAWIEASVDAHKKLNIEPKGIRIVGYDVADAGEDRNAIAIRHGFLLKDTQEWKGGEDELMKSSKRVYIKASANNSFIRYDSIGVGAACGSKFKELNNDKEHKISYYGFNAGGKVMYPNRTYMPKVKNKDHFANLKSQCWWLLGDRFRNTYNAVTKGESIDDENLISISSDCSNLEKLITELSTPKKDFDSNGRVKVESKKDLEKRGVKSPNIADSIVMAFAPLQHKELEISSY